MARAVLFGIAALGAAACVVPVAPKFEDDPNYPPVIVDSTPTVGDTISLEAQHFDESQEAFSITVADPNVDDELRIRWLIDYPKYDDRLTRTGKEGTLPPSGDVVRPPSALLRFTPDCTIHSIARGITQHRLTVAVADRDFLRPDNSTLADEGRLDSVPEGGYRVRAVWTFNLDCR